MNLSHSSSPWESDQLLAALWAFQTNTKDCNLGTVY